jgi:outer membrane protein assembly factor BamB
MAARNRLGRKPSLTTLFVALMAALLLSMALAAVPASASRAAGSRRPLDSPPAYVWPKIAYSDNDDGVSPDPTISSANASKLGVRWMASTGGSILSSPVVAYNAALGETLVYQGNEAGYMTAFSEDTGAVVWSTYLGSPIRDTPLVDGDGNVWISDTFDPSEFKLNGATGAVECTTPMVSVENGTATEGDPNGVPTIFIAVLDLGDVSGPLYAINASNCSVEWKFTNYNTPIGSWDPLSYGTNANGIPVVLVGTADTDDSIYEINAITGVKLWSFKTAVIPGDSDTDIGAGVDISPPGTNGFADGVAYVGGKDGYEYALDLTTGAMIWDFDFRAATDGQAIETKSTPALVGNQMIFGETDGVYDLNATTGAVNWRYVNGGGEVLSAICIVGPSGEQVIAVASLNGTIDVLDLATGAVLYSYQTGGFSTSSVADTDGNLLASSSNGFLYDIAAGGGNTGAPTTTVTSPTSGTTLTYPTGGNLTITGTASGAPIAGVNVAIQSGGSSGTWWNATSGTWTTGYDDNPATVASPGSSSTTWSLTIPVPPSGGVYRVEASAAGTNGLADITADSSSLEPSQSDFTVKYLKSNPHIYVSQGKWLAPGSKVTVGGSGFADGETVQLSLEGKVIGTATATSTGDVPLTDVTILTEGVFGPADLLATGETSGKTASFDIDVSNDWDQMGYDSLQSGTEPFDATMADHVAPSQKYYLDQAWSYLTGAEVQTEPSIYRDVDYFGDDAGTFTALNVQNSEALWTVTEPSAIDSSAALDSGKVFFGTEGGSVVALAMSTGKPAWTTTTSSAVESSPSVADGVVYVGSDNGTVYALNEKTGAVEWSAIVGGAVKGSPAVDATAGLVLVGDSTGTITALSLDEGAVVWSYAGGGSIDGSVTISGGNAYAASTNDTVYALDETTGAKVWSRVVGGSVVASGALYWTGNASDPQDYDVGASNGDLYFLSLTTGRISKSVVVGGAIVGVSTTRSWVVATTSTGTIAGDRPGNVAWKFTSKDAYASTGITLNGVVYVGGLDETVRAFTLPGRAIP